MKPFGIWNNNLQVVKEYMAYNSLGFPIGKFKIIADGRDFTPEELNEEAERALHCEVVTRCELVDILDAWGRSKKKVKLREGSGRFDWGKLEGKE